MAQHDYVIANGTGAAVRSDLNNALAAIVSQNSGATAPATTYAFQFWADTTTGLLKLRNSANSAWVTLFQLDGEWSTLPVENGTAAAPSIYFKDSGTDTGFYSPGTDQIGISTAGTSRLTIDANGNLAVDTNTLYVDAPNNRVGIGTSSPSGILHTKAAANQFIGEDSATGNIFAIQNTGGATTLNSYLSTTGRAPIIFTQYTTEVARFDASGRLGIGSTLAGNANNRTLIRSDNTSAITNVLLLNNGLADNYAGTGVRINLSGVSEANSNIRYAYIESATASGNNDHYIAFGTNSPSTTPLERVRIDSSGRLLVGTSSVIGNNHWGTAIKQQLADDTAGTAAQVTYSSTGADYYSSLELMRARGSASSPANVINGDFLGAINFYGYNSSGSTTSNKFQRAALIRCEVDGSPANTADDMPGRLVFSTTADGASSPTERLRIANNGAWGLGGANYGSSSQVLTSNGSGSAPTWQTVTAAAPAALSTASGSAPSYSARAWVNFNGSGAVAIRANGNVSSITDNGTGDYTVNFTTAMADANYAVTGIPEFTNSRPDPTICIAPSGLQTGSVQINVGMSSGLYMDTNTVCVSIFR